MEQPKYRVIMTRESKDAVGCKIDKTVVFKKIFDTYEAAEKYARKHASRKTDAYNVQTFLTSA